jgi:NAD(P)-dependent dehydrogenase (short-subunit alcohol dehydrogenase family)
MVGERDIVPSLRGGRRKVDIAGTTALVTGGASGLGRATVEALVSAGAAVVVVDLPSSQGEALLQELGGERVRFAPADVTSEDQVNAAIEEAVRSFGGLHIVVNCAGVAVAARLLDREGAPHPLDLFASTVHVNLIGTFNVVRLACARMARQEPFGEERGVVINTASVAAFEGQIGQSAYAASKGGVVSLTLALARDLATLRIRVVTISPGLFDTPMMAGLPVHVRESLPSAVPHPRRLGRPQEYAALALHIVENSMINGEVIRLDGGLRMPPRPEI